MCATLAEQCSLCFCFWILTTGQSKSPLSPCVYPNIKLKQLVYSSFQRLSREYKYQGKKSDRKCQQNLSPLCRIATQYSLHHYYAVTFLALIVCYSLCLYRIHCSTSAAQNGLNSIHTLKTTSQYGLFGHTTQKNKKLANMSVIFIQLYPSPALVQAVVCISVGGVDAVGLYRAQKKNTF